MVDLFLCRSIYLKGKLICLDMSFNFMFVYLEFVPDLKAELTRLKRFQIMHNIL